MNRKGQFGSLQQIGITLLVVGVILGLTLVVMSTISEEMVDTTNSVPDENFTAIISDNGTYVVNNYNSVPCWKDFSVIGIINTSTGEEITSGNYTYTSLGKISNLTSEYTDLNDLWSVNYTYKYGAGEGCNAVEKTITAGTKIPSWIGLIVLLLIIGVVLGLIFKMLPGMGKGDGSVAEI